MMHRFFRSRGGAPATDRAAKPGSRRDRRRRPALEALDGRALLSLFGAELPLSLNPQHTTNDNSAVATSSNGTSVVVWVNNFAGNDSDIWAQRFDVNGLPAGAPIMVDFTTAESLTPRVSMDSQGRFAVTWENFNPNGTSSVLMRYFDASGTSLTPITDLSGPAGYTDFEPDVAASDGSFVVTWARQYSTTDDDIVAERFVITGGVPQAQGIFFVNVDSNIEQWPRVAMAPDGRFDITYQRHYAGADWDIFANQYDSTGRPVGGNVLVNFDSASEFLPSISMDDAGDAVVAYERTSGGSYGIYANRLSSTGVVGPMLTVQAAAAVNYTDPSVAVDRAGGTFVVAYDTGQGVQATVFRSDDTPLTNLEQVNGISPSISIDGLGRYFVTYTRYNVLSGHDDIFGRRGFPA